MSASAAVLLVLGCAPVAGAQTASQAPPSSPPPTEATRPATTTFFGDTGLWDVPTAEALQPGGWSTSLYRRGTDYAQGHTNVADFAATFGVGIKRAEIFGSFLVDTRVDRDAVPLFFNDPAQGGIVDRDPNVNQPWTGNSIGDFYVGAKVNLTSQSRGSPVATAVRVMVKLPTGNTTTGVSTGKADELFDFVVSGEAARAVELSSFAGFAFLGNPDGFQIPTRAFRWGVGAGFPSRSPLRVVAELDGSRPTTQTATITTASLVGVDFSVPPAVSTTGAQTRATVGVTFQAPAGFFVGVGLTLSLPRASPAARTGEPASNWDWQVRLGFHPGVARHVPSLPPAPPPPAPAAPMMPPPVHTLTVKAECDECSIEILKTSTVTATALDSIGCALTYHWSAPAGSFADADARSTTWTAPGQDGRVPVTVTAACPTDNKTASDSVDIQVNAPPVKSYSFEDVYFDFDGYSLRPEAMRVLDEAAAAMKQDPTLHLDIQGFTCNIGTAEYNLALGERRATSVKSYLVSLGISADRLKTVSFGEENAKYDNGREETRRLNRRAALVVTLQR